MNKKVSIIGGDLRIVKLAEMLVDENYQIAVHGLDDAETLNNNNKVKKCESIKELMDFSDTIIGPIPLTSNNKDINMTFSDKNITIQELFENMNEKTFIAGRIDEELKNMNLNNVYIDLLKREELTVLNTISTAEGAIQIAMEETGRTLHGSNILIMGFGRISKVLSNMLKGIGSNVYCETTNNVKCSWIKAYGYEPVLLNNLNKELNKFHIIINTIPHIILDETNLNLLRKDCVIIDLASNPGGVDRKQATKQGIKLIRALSLPGKVAPITSAEYIKDTLDNILKEIN